MWPGSTVFVDLLGLIVLSLFAGLVLLSFSNLAGLSCSSWFGVAVLSSQSLFVVVDSLSWPFFTRLIMSLFFFRFNDSSVLIFGGLA